MGVIKKQFKDFWAYYRLCRCGYNQNQYMRSNMPLLLAVVIGTMLPFIQLGLGDGGSGISFNLWWFALVGAAFGMGMATSHRPTLISVAPFSPKQRVVFSYLTMALQTVIFSVIYAVIMIAFFAFVALCYFIFSGENIFVVSNDPEFTKSIFYSANGRAMQILFMIMNAFSIYAAMNLKKFKSRCMATVGFYIGYEIFALSLVNGCSIALGGRRFLFMGDVWHWADNLSDAWIITVIMATFVAISFALSVALSVRRHKSGKF